MKKILLSLFIVFISFSCSFKNYSDNENLNDSDQSDHAEDSDEPDESEDSDDSDQSDDSDDSDDSDQSDQSDESDNDSGDTGNTGDSGNTGNSGNTGDTGNTGNTGEGLFVRIIAANLTSGNGQDYDLGHGIRMLNALKPDIVLVQEMNYKSNSDANYKEFSQAILGTDYYAVESGVNIPNGIISKWPITSNGYWNDPTLTDRELMWGIIDIPGPIDIFAVSVHLHTSPSSDQVTASLVIVDEVKKHKNANPGQFYYVVGGDFNGTSSVSSNGFGKDGTFYVSSPHPADDNGNVNTNANRNSQYDFVLGDNTMHGFQIPVVYKSNVNYSATTYTNGLVFDTRTFSQSELDEYFPDALTSDSGASSMQHMAVVKDYFID